MVFSLKGIAMKIPVNVERERGLFSTLGYPESARLLDGFLSSSRLEASPIGRSLAALSVADTRTHFGLKDWAKKSGLFHCPPGEDIGYAGSVHRLSCESIALSARAERGGRLKITESSTGSSSCEVKILGVGGGDAFKLKYEAADTLEVREVCQAFIYSFRAIWEFCEIAEDDGRATRFVRLQRVFPDCEKLLLQRLEPEPCFDKTFDPRLAEEQCEVDLRGQDGVTVTKTLKVVSEIKFKGSAKVELEAFGLDIGAKFEGERSYETEFHYVLPGGRRYLAFRPPDAGAWLWHTN